LNETEAADYTTPGAMPQPTAPRPSPAAEQESPEPGSAAPAKAADLTVNKVLAGAGAAATSAVLGSYFGATGTVAGAALGSVASTVATTLYQRSLDRTRDTIVAKVRLTGGRSTDLSDTPTVQLTAPEPSESPDEEASPDEATVQLHVEPVLRPRRKWLWIGATVVLVFALGLLVVTGLEWAKGSSLTTDQPGTSVGRVLTPASGGRDRTAEPTSEAPTSSAVPSTEPTATSTDEPTESTEPSAGATSTDEPDSDTDSTRDNERGGTATPLRTPEIPVPDARQND
jgi:hypothetical protein